MAICKCVTLNQNVFDQRVFIGLKAAKSTREFYLLNSELTNEQIIENVATAYYQVFVQEENLKTVEESYANTEKVRNVIKSLVDNGWQSQLIWTEPMFSLPISVPTSNN
jgi:outer membrane protein TolC